MPPGRSGRVPAKNSRVKSVDTPAIQGFTGSEMITSYLLSESSSANGVADDQARARIVERVVVLLDERARASTTRVDFRYAARSIGCFSAGPSVTRCRGR